MRLMMLLTALVFSQVLTVSAQQGDLSIPVSVHYDRVTLRQAFNDLERRYHVRFSYSSDHIPLGHRVSVHREQTPLQLVLDDLFADTQIAYAYIGKQIVLKNDPRKPIRDPWQEPPVGIGYRKPEIELLPLGSRPLTTLAVADPEEEVRQKAILPVSEDRTVFSTRRKAYFPDSLGMGLPADKRYIQLSVFPPFGTNAWESGSLTNLYSVNLLAGFSAGVEGSEWSLLSNTTEGRVRGIQAAFLSNVSTEGLAGTQLAGGFNLTLGRARGRQFSFLMNAAREMTGTQLCLGVNYAGREFRGRQIAGLCNLAGGIGAPGSLQLSALGNYSKGNAGSQIGAVNYARAVFRSQVGLINVSDTVGGATIGLLNLVWKGYNHLEVAGSESLWASAAFKLGSRRFYNVFYGGLRWGLPGEEDIWGLGYGVGTNFTLARRLDLNLEGLSIHLSKGKKLVRQLNLLNQVRLTLDWRLARHFGLFAGGTLNLMVSNVADPDTGAVGYDLAPYTWYEHTSQTGTGLKGWAGVLAGIRF